jgi:low affinity Fe/Cu permease
MDRFVAGSDSTQELIDCAAAPMIDNPFRPAGDLTMSSGGSSRRRSQFGSFAKSAARAAGHPLAFLLAAAIIVLWALVGPLFGFGDTWQLVINTATTIITFLMVFLIQNTQNRDSAAMQIKLDELIRATRGAHNALLDLEELEEDQLEAWRRSYEQLAADARSQIERGEAEIGTPQVNKPN